MNDNSLIKDIGRSYIVSSFIPAAIFFTIGTLIFFDFSPSFIALRFQENEQLYLAKWGLVIISVTWVSFVMYSGWHFTVKLFEGYFFQNSLLGKRLIKNHRTKLKKKLKIVQRVHFLQHVDRELTDEEIDEILKKQPSAVAIYSELEKWFPFSPDEKHTLILPTRLGNLLRASEVYPRRKFGFDGSLIWTRLVNVFPKHFSDQLEESNNKFIFLLNSSALSYSLGFICVIVSLIRIPCEILSTNFLLEPLLNGYSKNICSVETNLNFFQRGFTTISAGEYFLLGMVFLLLGYIVYYVSIYAALEFTAMIRSGYDLYRFDLLKALNYELPKNSEEEIRLWTKINEFLVCGNEMMKIPMDLNYKQNSQTNAQADSQPQTPSQQAGSRVRLFQFSRKRKNILLRFEDQ